MTLEVAQFALPCRAANLYPAPCLTHSQHSQKHPLLLASPLPHGSVSELWGVQLGLEEGLSAPDILLSILCPIFPLFWL